MEEDLDANWHQDESMSMLDARVEMLEAVLRDITYEDGGKVLVSYREYVDLAEKWPVLLDLHLQKSA